MRKPQTIVTVIIFTLVLALGLGAYVYGQTQGKARAEHAREQTVTITPDKKANTRKDTQTRDTAVLPSFGKKQWDNTYKQLLTRYNIYSTRTGMADDQPATDSMRNVFNQHIPSWADNVRLAISGFELGLATTDIAQTHTIVNYVTQLGYTFTSESSRCYQSVTDNTLHGCIAVFTKTDDLAMPPFLLYGRMDSYDGWGDLFTPIGMENEFSPDGGGGCQANCVTGRK